MKNAILIIGIVMLCGFLMAETSDFASQYKFLNVPYGPISIALGGRGVHSPGNATAFVLQPAAACELDQRILGVATSPWLVDTQTNALAYSYARRTDHFGIIMRNLDYGELENRDDTGYLIGHYNPLDLDIMANYAYRMSPSLYFGFNMGVLYQKLNTATSLGMHADFGFSMLPPVSGSKLSVAFRNFGTATKTHETKGRFPSSMEADISQSLKLGEQKLTLGASAIKTVNEDAKGSLNAELELMKLFKLRAGYKLNYDAEDISGGFGVNYRKISIDYGYAAFVSALTDVHSFGIAYHF